MNLNNKLAIAEELIEEELHFMVAPDRVGQIQVFFYGDPSEKDRDLLYDIADDYGLELESVPFEISDYFKEIYRAEKGYAYVFKSE